MATIQQIMDIYPRLYHLAERDSWPSIERHGLLSTTAILDLFGKTGSERYSIESEWRRSSVTIKHDVYGTAVIRDQLPMPPNALKAVLTDGVTPRQWYEFLNGKVFFWPTKDRLDSMVSAYRGQALVLIVVDTYALIEAHMDEITLSRINSGFARYKRGNRNFDTFQSIGSYRQVRRERDVAEFAVEYNVPNINDLVISAEPL